MSFVLSYVLPPADGAAFGKATMSEPCSSLSLTANEAACLLGDFVELDLVQLAIFKHRLMNTPPGTDVKHEQSDVIFRIDPEDVPPNVCECCGGLVRPTDQAFAGAPDALCLGCYTWGDTAAVPCSPHTTAHANPWTTDTAGAQLSMAVVIDHGDETGHDVRYTADAGAAEMWDDLGNALIAWPGLHPSQFIEIKIKEI